jgi:5S rRNA maturation endonuclease (ribonuclease M5)
LRAHSVAGWNEDRVKLLEKIFDELRCLEKDDLVVVEGRKDLQSLRLIGVRSNIITRRDFGHVIKVKPGPQMAKRRVVLLPDFDNEGRENMRTWQRSLERMGQVDDLIWRKLWHLAKREARGIEDLSALAQRLGLAKEDMWLDPDEQVS